MLNAAKKWIEQDAERFLKSIGVKKSQYILDFGCGNGTLAWDIAEHREEVKNVIKRKHHHE